MQPQQHRNEQQIQTLRSIIQDTQEQLRTIRALGYSGISLATERDYRIRLRDAEHELERLLMERDMDTVDFSAVTVAFTSAQSGTFIDNNIVIEEGLMKKRHLNQDERRVTHKPKSDYIESPRGDACRNTASLDVSDIVVKLRPIKIKLNTK